MRTLLSRRTARWDFWTFVRHCNYCALPHDCPAWDSYEELKGNQYPIQTMEEAEDVASLLTVAKRVAKLMELRLKGYVAKPGPRPTVAVKVDTGGMRSMLRGGSGESVQMAFKGQGWVLVQPSEGRPVPAAPGGAQGGLGGLLKG